MTQYVHLDFETYSCADLKKVGAYAYARHKSTDVLCAAYSFGNGPIRLWLPGDPYPFQDFDGIILAWNAGFERQIWNEVMCDYDWPKKDVENFLCVAAQARCQAIPGALDDATRFLQRKHKKDMKGHAHMLKMCKPLPERERKRYHSDDDRCHHTEENIQKLADYCLRDVAAERDVYSILEPWTDYQRNAYWEDEHINDTGLCVDVEFAEAAVTYADDEKAWFAERLITLTNGEIRTPKQFAKIKEWALPQMSEDAVKITEKWDKGVKKHTFDKNVREQLLLQAKGDSTFLADDQATSFKLEEFIDILDQAGKSTISKYQGICDRAIGDTPTVKGLYVFSGAAQTGRRSSMGLQVHNLYKHVPKEAGDLVEAFIDDSENYIRSFGHPIHTLAKLIRPTFTGCPDGKYDLMWGDWSAIEARILPWLANSPGADRVLDVYRRGQDLYLIVASSILGRTITADMKDERQAYGKVPVLSLGYGGSVPAFQALARNYGVSLEDIVVRGIVKGWRHENGWADVFWKDLHQAAFYAIRKPGMQLRAGRIRYEYNPDTLDGIGALWATLPSGRRLCYPGARNEIVQYKWGGEGWGITAMKGAWKPKAGTDDEWPRIQLWHGLLAENVTQAVNADILTDTIERAYHDYEFTVCGHTHDEIMVQTTDGANDSEALQECMETPSDWYKTLPLAAEVEYGYRYKVPFH